MQVQGGSAGGRTGSVLTRRAFFALAPALAQAAAPPNIVLLLSDDQGWGDTGYNGHPVLKTPHLDAMAAAGLRFDRFYAAAPVCSPTRGSCLTGRHPFRYGITWALGHGVSRDESLRESEVTIAEVAQAAGYTTGHFGKWHLGVDKRNGELIPTPGRHGFDRWFSTEKKVPTYNPYTVEGDGPYYEDGRRATVDLAGDDSRILMDRAIPFIEAAAAAKRPFLAVIWFHSPHEPVLAGPEHRRMYAAEPEKAQHYYGAITAMDEQIGRLRRTLRELGVAGNTLVWFSSDNGPEGDAIGPRSPGSAGPFRGRKRSLFEGGIRVPAILEWPSRVTRPAVTSMVCSTSDVFPTLVEAMGRRAQPAGPLDGISLLPLLDGKMRQRPSPLAFETQGDRRQTRGSPRLALIENRYKLLTDGTAEGEMLYDVLADPRERINLAGSRPAVADVMRRQLLRWSEQCARDYGASGNVAKP